MHFASTLVVLPYVTVRGPTSAGFLSAGYHLSYTGPGCCYDEQSLDVDCLQWACWKISGASGANADTLGGKASSGCLLAPKQELNRPTRSVVNTYGICVAWCFDLAKSCINTAV